MKKKITILLLLTLLSGCFNGNNKFSIDEKKLNETSGKGNVTYDVDYYNNNDLNDITTGDPFVMRFNGAYYLYSSGSPLRLFKSIDLVDWELISTNIAPNFPYHHPYAPEVFYFNGYFYMYTSPGGNGHYVLKSKYPEGPFEQVSEKFDTYIDGDVFIDDDETMYFLHHGGGGIMIGSMDDMETINTGTYTFVSNTINTGGQTEGPYILKKDGFYYLTYTGTEVTSDGYRIFYAYSDTKNPTSLTEFASSFKDGPNNPVLLNADKEEGLVGLGHSSTVMGPDLDSYYIVYHDYTRYRRSLNVDRLLFSGSLMSTADNAFDAIRPSMPDYYSYGKSNKFTQNGDFYLLNESTSDMFTIEFNSKKDAETKYVFSYQDDNNYNYVFVDYLGHKITLNEVKNGLDNQVAQGTLKNDFSSNDNHTVRVAYSRGVINVYFDNMCKISNTDFNASSGKVGYLSKNNQIEIGFTGFSNVANGLSDNKEIKQTRTEIPATNYMLENQVEGVESYHFTKNSGVISKQFETSSYDLTKAVYLSEPYDFTRYLVNIKETGTYALSLTLPTEYTNKKIAIQVDGDEHLIVDIPSIELDSEVVHLHVANLNLKKGIRQLKLQHVGDDLEIISFMLNKVITNKSIDEPLNSTSQELVYVTNGWDVSENGHYATNTSTTNRELIYLSNHHVTDLTIEVDIKIDEPKSSLTSSLGAGIVVHAQNFANNFRSESAHDDNDSIEGYYIKIQRNRITLRKQCYKGYSKDLTSTRITLEYNVSYTYKVEVKNNTITVYRNDEEVFSYTDDIAYVSGKTGFYTTGFNATYSNVKYIID